MEAHITPNGETVSIEATLTQIKALLPQSGSLCHDEGGFTIYSNNMCVHAPTLEELEVTFGFTASSRLEVVDDCIEEEVTLR